MPATAYSTLFSRRDTRWLRLIPKTLVLLFLLTMAMVVWMLDAREAQQRHGDLVRDAQWAEQTLQLRLEDTVSQLTTFAQAMSEHELAAFAIEQQISEMVANAPELALVARLGRDGQVLWGARQHEPKLGFLAQQAGRLAWQDLVQGGPAQFGAPFQDAERRWSFSLLLPVRSAGRFDGALAVVFDASAFLRRLPPAWFAKKYQLTLLDADGRVLSRSAERPLFSDASARLSLAGTGLRLEARPLKSALTPTQSLQLAVIAGLLLLAMVSLFMLTRHIRRRIETEDERNHIYRLSQDMLAIVGADMRLREINPAFARVLGYAADQLVGTDFLTYVDPAQRDGCRAEIAGILHAGARDRMVETVVCRHDGAQRWVLWAVSPLPGRGMVYLSGRDLTATRQAEAALRQESAYRKAMEDSLSVGIRAIDMDGRIEYVNPAFCRITGYAPDELVGCLPPYPYWPQGQARSRCQEALAAAMAGGFAGDGYEQVYVRKSGEHFYGHVLMSPLIDASGRHSGWMAAMTDVTEREEGKRRLLAAHERFETVVEGLNEALLVVDAENGELYFSNARYKAMLSPLAPGGVACDPLGRAWHAEPTEDDYEIEWAAPGGTRYLQVRRRAMRWVNARAAWMVLLVDVTRERQAEQRYAQQQQQVQAKSRLIMMGEMASTLAHELNQPLSAIANYQSGCILRLRQGRASAQSLLPVMEKISAQAERAGGIVRRVREFVKQREPIRKPCYIDEIVEATLAIVGIEARRHGARVELALAPALPAVEVDPILIEQVLINLVKNGVEAMHDVPLDARRVQLSARRVDAMVELAVQDCGHGVAPDVRERLFDAFFTTKQDGMGMGLNICRSIVELHRGRLWLAPAPGGGSIFYLTLPIAEQTCLTET